MNTKDKASALESKETKNSPDSTEASKLASLLSFAKEADATNYPDFNKLVLQSTDSNTNPNSQTEASSQTGLNASSNSSSDTGSTGSEASSSPQLSAEQAELKLKLKRDLAQKIEALAKSFDYSSFKDSHVDSCRFLHGKEVENFAEPTSFVEGGPLTTEGCELMAKRFRGFYPVVLDIETSGLDPQKHCILQLAAIAMTFNEKEELVPYARLKLNIHPLEGCELDANSFMITEINPFDYKRKALTLKSALTAFCKFVRSAQKAHGCKRSIMVAHNATFDSGFLYKYLEQSKVKRNPFHPFVIFDTGVLGAVFVGDTRLHQCVEKIGINYNHRQAHDALYDTELAAELFRYCVNQRASVIGSFIQDDVVTGYES